MKSKGIDGYLIAPQCPKGKQWVDTGYTDSAAKYLGEGRFGVFYTNDPDGFEQSGADTTPWRVMLDAKDLQTLLSASVFLERPAPRNRVRSRF